jgi:hypothetical protein
VEKKSHAVAINQKKLTSPEQGKRTQLEEKIVSPASPKALPQSLKENIEKKVQEIGLSGVAEKGKNNIVVCQSNSVNIDLVSKNKLKVVSSAKKIDEIAKGFFTKLESKVPIPSKPRELKRKIVDAWIEAQPESMRPAFKDLIQNVERVSFDTFYDNFLHVVSYVNEKIEKGEIDGTYIVLLVEPRKSNKWLAELALPFLNILPNDVASLGKKGKDYNSYLNQLEADHKTFPKSLIFFDDGIYSGKQMSTFVNSVFESSNKYNEERASKGLEPIPIPHVTVACPYMTKYGEKKILDDNKKWSDYLDLSPHQEIHTLDEVLGEKSKQVLSDSIWKSDPRNEDGSFKENSKSGPKSRGNIWFDHKVPNYMSFVDAIEFGVVYDESGDIINGKFIEDEQGERIFILDSGKQFFDMLPQYPPPYK